MSEFAPICIYLVMSPLVSLIPLGVPFPFASNSSTYPEKLSAHECGSDPSGDARSRFDIRRGGIPFFFLTIIVGFLYLLSLQMGLLDYLKALLSKVGLLLGGRALSFFFIKMGCAGGLSLAIVFALRALLAAEATPFVGNSMTSQGDVTPSSSSGSWRKYVNWEGDSNPEPSTARAPALREEAALEVSSSNQGETGVAPGQAPLEGPSEPSFPSVMEVKEELRSVLSSFSKRKPSASFIESTEDALDLQNATPAKLRKIVQVLDNIRGPGRPNSGQNAKALLTMKIEAWERGVGGGGA